MKILIAVCSLIFIQSCQKGNSIKAIPILPVADFNSTLDTMGSVSFINISSNANNYIWNFGDSSMNSVEPNPTHKFPKNGNYNVSLKAIGSGGIANKTNTVTISGYQNDIVAIDTRIEAFLALYKVPGMQIAITKNGKLVYAKSYGLADVATNTAVTNNNLFRVASVSKSLTSIAIMKLVENGQLALDQKVFGAGNILGTQFGNLPYGHNITNITVRELLQHTCGGWGNSSDDPMFSDVNLSQKQVMDNTLNNLPLEYEPGKHYDYSNFGYCVLGRVIEKMTNMPYDQWLKTNVLKVCGVNAMQIAGNTFADKKANEVTYYGQNGEDPYSYNITRMDSHGGWIASATDLARIMVKVDGISPSSFLNATSISNMTTPSVANPNYACGWAVNSSNNWWHMGSLPGTTSEIIRTASGFNWVVLCNARNQSSSFTSDFDNLLWPVILDSTTPWQNINQFE